MTLEYKVSKGKCQEQSGPLMKMMSADSRAILSAASM